MLAKTESVALIGTEARLIEVEVQVGTGLPTFRIVGLPAKSVMEAEQRTRAALLSSSERWPPQRITANLAPGALRKEGTHFDLPIALGVMAADRRLDPSCLEGWIAVGELGLDGSVRPVRGILAAAIEALASKRKGLICPAGNAPEAAVIDGIKVVPVLHLRDAIDFLKDRWTPPAVIAAPEAPAVSVECISEVKGQDDAKHSLEIAAAGGHNVMMVGPPGSGKTMLARRLPGILPDMSIEESFEVTKLYSIAGLLPERATLIRTRPFRAPHQNVSIAGLIGGGSGLARPGEVSLAHRGVLFMDELSLFRNEVVNSLRAPVEEGVVRLARSGGVVTYPASFSFVAATNPCPCGYAEDPRCKCSDRQIAAHDSKLSGPLLDRVDMLISLHRVGREELMSSPGDETSAIVRERVEKARLIQAERYGSSTKTNANVSNKQLHEALHLDLAARVKLGSLIDHRMLSGRGMNRVLRVARTLADLEGEGRVRDDHISQAGMLRFESTTKESKDD